MMILALTLRAEKSVEIMKELPGK